MNMIMVRKDYSVRSSKPNPCMPGLGQGHGRKRHLQAKIVMQVRGIVLMHDKTGTHVRSSFSNKGGLTGNYISILAHQMGYHLFQAIQGDFKHREDLSYNVNGPCVRPLFC
jgi:hypothetical protein